MPDYRAIYNEIAERDPRYNLAENSPGFRAAVQATDQLQAISGRSLDFGCGIGFVVEYLSGASFDLLAFGVDVSDRAIEKAKQRLSDIPGIPQRLSVLQTQQLPFEDDYFSLVTCFDVLEHLDPDDIQQSWSEILRVLRPGGLFLGSVSCRKSGVQDKFGDNLHRTVRSVDWWLEQLDPDRAKYDGIRNQLKIWKQPRLVKQGRPTKAAKRQTAAPNTQNGNGEGDENGKEDGSNTAALYQKIYDENPWYGDADEGRCPGVRLLPQFAEWLVGPVMDLGCGRGQMVEKLREMGLEAEGIDQINKHPGMRVGDITQPISDMRRFNSVVCIDCIEHLYDEQLVGLFENMKQVKRQAFSIHNGESTGTGQELHVNRQDFMDWDKRIRQHFEIAAAIQIHPQQVLYLTQSRAE